MSAQRVECVVLRFMETCLRRSYLQQSITGAKATEKAKCKRNSRGLSEVEAGHAMGCY